MKYGDVNTKFFHATSTILKKNNGIIKLCNNQGIWKDNQEGLCNLVSNYFQNLYQCSESNSTFVVDYVPFYISLNDNNIVFFLFPLMNIVVLCFLCILTNLQILVG